MALPKKTKQPTAITSFTNLDLSSQHVTTADFMQLNIAKCMEVVPDQSVKIEMETFARLDPLPVPTFGRAKIHNRAYFVPFRTIWRPWNSFINDVPYIARDQYGIPPSVPTINNQAITELFRDDLFSTLSKGAYDFRYTVYGNTGNEETETAHAYRNFTSFGRYAYKIMRSLGYAPDFTNRRHYVSALPLLSFIRVYVDFFYPSQYNMNSDCAFLQELLTDDRFDSSSSMTFSFDVLKRIFIITYNITYDNDYFTSAWDYPDAPNHGLASDITIRDIDTGTADVSYNVEGGEYNSPTLATRSDGGGQNKISQYALNALRSLTDYMKRNQIAGSRIIDRFFARFGIKLVPEKLNRCVYLGEITQDLQFGDVTSMADTEGATLGTYAGRGVSFGQGNFSYESDEYGMIIIISTIVPFVQYYQGQQRLVQHIDKLDFWTPEFDNLGTQAIGANEVYVPMDGVIPVNYSNQVFGFAPRYAEYKVPYSQITGDFLLGSRNVGKDAWTLFRDITPIVDSVGIDGLVHNPDFVTSSDSAQYNRIFQINDDSLEHIYVIHNFNISSRAPFKSLYDTYEFESEGKADKVTIDVNGDTHN